MLDEKEVVDLLQAKLDSARDYRDRIGAWNASSTDRSHLSYQTGVADGLGLAIVWVNSVIHKRDLPEKRYYVCKDGFQDGTAYVERSGRSRVCFFVNGGCSDADSWESYENSAVERGHWVEITEEEAKKLVKEKEFVPLRYYIHITGFFGKTAYLERQGNVVHCVSPNGDRRLASRWSSLHDECVENGIWVEVGEKSAKKMLKEVKNDA